MLTFGCIATLGDWKIVEVYKLRDSIRIYDSAATCELDGADVNQLIKALALTNDGKKYYLIGDKSVSVITAKTLTAEARDAIIARTTPKERKLAGLNW